MLSWPPEQHTLIKYFIRYTCLIEDVVKTTWINSNWESEWGRNGEARHAALSISETADLLVYSYTTTVFYRFTENGSENPLSGSFVDKYVEWTDWLGKNRKATVTWYNQEMQNNISEHITHQTMNNMGSYSSRRPHRLPLLSAQNSQVTLQFVHFYQAPKYQLSVV